ncbi:phage tail assembly protein [Sphingomonas sp. UYP23]
MADIPDELVITLRKPVTLGETFTTITLREPTGAQMMEIDKLEGWAADVKAIALVSGLPEPAVKMIGARDLRIASKYLGSFLLDGPSIGANA